MIHSDVCGRLNVKSPRGSRYFVLFKDDCTGYRTLYFLQHKSEVFDRFKEYEALVVTQTNNRIKVLRTDNGKEYLSQEFGDFLRKRGIVHEKSTPYVHQQNGRTEQEMRTLVKSARSMLIAKNLPEYLWAEAIQTASYVLNRTISKQMDGMTAYEKWFKRKPKIEHMKIFGSDAYKNIPKEKRNKLDPKSKKMIFVGYEGDSTNYRLWDPANKKIHVSCNVDFNEVVEESDIVAEKSKKKVFRQWSFGDYDDMEPEDHLEDHPEDYLEDHPEGHLEDQSENQPKEVGEQ